MKRGIDKTSESKRAKLDPLSCAIPDDSEEASEQAADNSQDGPSEENFDEPEHRAEDPAANPDLLPLDEARYLPTQLKLAEVDRGAYDFQSSKFMGEAASGLKHHTAADLELALDFEDVFGMPLIREALISRIYRVVQNPGRYRIGAPLLDGVTMVQRFFYFYGRHGTGVRSLIKGFCKRTGIALIEALGAQFQPATQITEAYQLAEAMQPAIVLFNDCEHHFAHNSPHVVTLADTLKRIAESGGSVWTIFRSEFTINAIDGRLSTMFDYPMWSQVPDDMARSQLWIKALKTCMPVSKAKPSDHPQQPGVPVSNTKLPINLQQLRVLLDRSIDCIPRNIFAYVRHCYNQKISGLEHESPLHEDDSINLTMKDLDQFCYGGQAARITSDDPTQRNIREFGQISN